MSTYILQANNTNQTTPVLKKGPVKISTSVAIYWTVGENPVIVSEKSALLRSGQTLNLRIPVKCSKLAIQAVNTPGLVTVTEISGGAKASCS